MRAQQRQYELMGTVFLVVSWITMPLFAYIAYESGYERGHRAGQVEVMERIATVWNEQVSEWNSLIEEGKEE